MNETRYLISETAKMTQVEPHVLRYWEEELGLAIGRNEMGHRYYTDKDIQTFLTVKELKKKGLQLRAIRTIIQQGETNTADFPVADSEASFVNDQGQPVIELQEKSKDKKSPKKQMKSKEERFSEIMERLIHDIELDERKEGRYRRLDEAIRKHQQSRKMVAATEENAKRNSKRKIREKKSKGHAGKENRRVKSI